MSTLVNHLLFWDEWSVYEHADNGLPLDHVASNELAGVSPGDTIWIVTISKNKIFLAGRLIIGEILEYEDAWWRMPDHHLLETEYYAFPAKFTETCLQPIALSSVARDLRFKNSDADRLHIWDGRINPQQLQTMKELTHQSAEVINDLWNNRDAFFFDFDFENGFDRAELLTFYRRAAEKNPNDARAQHKLGDELDWNRLFEEAVGAYRRAIELDAASASSYYRLGEVLLKLERTGEAIEVLNFAVLANYDRSSAHFLLGEAYAMSGEFDKCVDAIMIGLDIDPINEVGHFDLGRAYFDKGEFGEALEAFTRAINLAPDFDEADDWIGKCHQKLGTPEIEIDLTKRP